MSKQRDELALEIFIADNSNQSREQSTKDWEWFATTKIRGDYTKRYENFADHLLAAGCTKPRTIATEEELSALDGSVVLRDDADQLYEQNWELNAPNEKWWECLSEPGHTKQNPMLPATVLYEATS